MLDKLIIIKHHIPWEVVHTEIPWRRSLILPCAHVRAELRTRTHLCVVHVGDLIACSGPWTGSSKERSEENNPQIPSVLRVVNCFHWLPLSCAFKFSFLSFPLFLVRLMEDQSINFGTLIFVVRIDSLSVFHWWKKTTQNTSKIQNKYLGLLGHVHYIMLYIIIVIVFLFGSCPNAFLLNLFALY